MNAAADTAWHDVPDLSQWVSGLHEDVPAELYHRRELGVVNKGALDQLAKTPAHYRAWVDGADQSATPAMIFGSACHALILQPELFARHWAEAPAFGDLRTKKAREARDAWQETHAGVQLLTSDDWQCLHAMREAVMAHPVAGELFQGGDAEVTALWDESRTGLRCKARFDYWRPDLAIIADLKTTTDASPAGFAKSVANYRYHVQHAHYTEGACALGHDDVRFLFVAVEKAPPYAVVVHMLDAEAAMRGDDLRERGMATLVDCLKTDTWPGYSAEVNTLSLPNWAFSD